MDLTLKNEKSQKRLLRVATIFIIIILVLIISVGIFIKYYENKTYPGVKVNNFNLGGLDEEQVGKVVLGEFNQVFNQGIKIKFEETEKLIPYTFEEVSTITAKNDSMAKDILQIGRGRNVFDNLYQIGKALIVGKEVQMQVDIDNYLLEQQLQSEFGAFESPAKNSQVEVEVTNEKKKEYLLTYSIEKNGQGFNYDLLVSSIEEHLENFNNETIVATLEKQTPVRNQEQAQAMQESLVELYKIENLTLQYKDETYEIDWPTLSQIIVIDQDENEEAIVKLSEQLLYGHIMSFSQTLNREPQDAKFQIQNNRVTEFEASLNGQEVDMEASYEKINQEFINEKIIEVTVLVNETEPKVQTSEVNDLGITQLVGLGTSDFSGSPSNRRHNIGVGAAALNGILIAPGEEFKLMPYLGSIDASNGYLPELVIKGNETIPEYGGGLCQIGTTVFRVAVNTGLPITERRNHSYRVSYYEPAGTDATIYSPRPDVRFVNDYDSHLLLKTSIKGNILYFELWGTTDDRKIEVKDPVIYNIVSPGPTKIIESEELAPGQKKCIESAHAGADAYFDRIITYADGEVNEKRWSSHYVPWQAVCLVGVDPVAKEAEAQKLIEEEKAAEEAAKLEGTIAEEIEEPVSVVE